MPVNLITNINDFGQAFNQVNANANEQIVSVQLVGSDLVFTKFDNTTITTTLPISQGIALLSPVGSIIIGSSGGAYNQVSISPFDYLLDGNSFSVSSTTYLTMPDGEPTFDMLLSIFVDASDNTVKLRTGVPSTSPQLADLSVLELLLGVVYIKATASSTLGFYSLIYTAFKSQVAEVQIVQQQIKSNISELLDVTISNPLNNEVLTWNSTISKWENKALSSSGGTGIYELASPSTVAVGGLPVGYNLFGQGIDKILEDMLVQYQSPTFTAFSFSSQDTTIEVGTPLAGTKTANWITTQPGNINTNSIEIYNQNTSTLLAGTLANDGTELISIGTISNLLPITQNFQIRGTNTNSIIFTRNYTINSVYPIFYGVYDAGAVPAGSGRPLNINFLLGLPHTKMALTTNPSAPFDINFNSIPQEYLWFAVPMTSPAKTTWVESGFNFGNIGGAVGPTLNLFPTPNTPLANSPDGYWSGVQYKLYVSNYQTEFTTPITFS